MLREGFVISRAGVLSTKEGQQDNKCSKYFEIEYGEMYFSGPSRTVNLSSIFKIILERLHKGHVALNMGC